MSNDHLLQSRSHAAPAPSPRRVLVVHNPAAGRRHGRRLDQVLARLRDLGCVVECRATTRRGDAEDFARQASRDAYDVVAAAGGDGTVNEIVNGLAAGGGGMALAVIPLGTANILALEIGLDIADGDAVAHTIAFGPIRRVHPGVANGRHFLLMAGAGLDAQVVAGLNPEFKRRTGRLAYVVESVRQALGYDFPEIRVRANGRTYRGRMAVACKGRYYGGPFVAAPQAGLDKPQLDVCILPRSGMAGLMRYGLALPLNRLSELPEIEHVTASTMTILGPRGAPLQGDGDIVARLPAEIGIADTTVDLIVPGP
jgi:YegS/Rv2252/BmrU family lipid kinase